MPLTLSQAARCVRIPLAGGGQETLLSEVGAQYLLPLFTTAEACALRLVCREFLAAVTEQPWEDTQTVIQGSIAAWRACFPRARCANVQQWGWRFERRAAPVGDADFVHFEGLRQLYMAGCRDVTDAAFVHLRGIHTLDMSYCGQAAITDAAFAHLAGIQRLSIMLCHQATITDAAFLHLQGIQLLNIGECRQLTDAAFLNLRGIRTLFMWYCTAITDAAFVHLRGIHTLVMEGCRQATITGVAFAHLKGIQVLGMCECRDEQVETARSLALPVNFRRCIIERPSLHL